MQLSDMNVSGRQNPLRAETTGEVFGFCFCGSGTLNQNKVIKRGQGVEGEGIGEKEQLLLCVGGGERLTPSFTFNLVRERLLEGRLGALELFSCGHREKWGLHHT